MPKTVCYECDGGCGARREMAVGQYPQGWCSITLLLRAFQRPPQLERKRGGGDDADATAYIHLCGRCKQPKLPALVFEKLVDESRRIPSHHASIAPR